MRRTMIVLALVGFLVVPALASQIYEYSWSGTADYLGSFNSEMSAAVGAAYNRTGSEGNGLLLTMEANLPYTRGFLATVWGLEDGDQVTVSVWRFDNNTNMPYFALWAHYNDALDDGDDARSQNMSIDDGNIYGDQRLGDQHGWEEYSHTWTVSDGHVGMVIDAQIYGDPNDQMMVDDITITVPDHASVRLPDAVYRDGGVITATEATSWTEIRSLFE